MKKINSSAEVKTPKKPNILDLNVGLTNQFTNQLVKDFKRILSDIVKFHKGSGKNKNYTIEFNNQTGEYKVFYKKTEFATVNFNVDFDAGTIEYTINADGYITDKLNEKKYVS